MAKVYRLENAVGTGPFQGAHIGNMGKLLKEFHCWDHPAPQADIQGLVDSKKVCGFESMEQLHEWFPPEMLELAKVSGFTVKTYESKEIDYGRRQLMFKKGPPCIESK